MSKPSVAQQLEHLTARPARPGESHFYDLVPSGPEREAAHPDEPDPMLVSPWEGRTRAEADLRWYWCQSSCDLGERSTWESLCFSAMVGAAHSTPLDLFNGEPTARPPNHWQLWAAERYGRIRRVLGQLTPQHQAVLEMAYTLRKPNPQIRGLLTSYGHGHLEPIVSYLHRTGQVAFKLDGSGKGTDGLEHVCSRAARLLDAALRAYEDAAGLVTVRTPSAPPTVKQRTGKGKPPPCAILVPRGVTGASKRTLIHVPRRLAEAV